MHTNAIHFPQYELLVMCKGLPKMKKKKKQQKNNAASITGINSVALNCQVY